MHQNKVISPQLSTIGKGRLMIIHLAFFLLFPGFFFYQTLIGIGAINAFLGGYFSIISLLSIPPLAFIYITEAKRDRKFFCITDFYYIIFITYISFIVAINFTAGADYKIARDYLLSIIFSINIFIILKMIDLNDSGLKIISTLSLAIMSAIVFYFSADGLFYLADLGVAKNPESVASYQGFARSYLLTFVVAISLTKPFAVRILMYFVAIPALFINGARSEFVALLFIIPIIEICNSEKKLRTAIIFSLLLIFMKLIFDYIIIILPRNRILQIFDLSQSNSANLRHDYTMQALQTIYTDPIFGGFGDYIYGEYAHNILATWVDFGLFGFFFALVILIWPALRLGFLDLFLRIKSSYFVLASSLIFMSVLLVFTSKNFEGMYVGAALGAYANFRYRRKYV